MTRYYLDENQPDLIATEVRRLALDITTTRGQGHGGNDESQLRYAASEGRCIVTKNYNHFIALTHRSEQDGLPHAGVVLVPRWTKRHHARAIAQALLEIHKRYPDGLRSTRAFGYKWRNRRTLMRTMPQRSES